MFLSQEVPIRDFRPSEFGDSTMDRNEALFDRAREVIPGGVNSPVRAFRSVGGAPRFIR